MRHVILFVLAIAAAFWLAPALHVLPQHAKIAAEVAILGVFAAADLVAGLLRKPARGPARPATPYAAPARRR